MRHFWETLTSKAYWQYVLFSRAGLESIFAIFGFFYLSVEVLDFFSIFTRDKYAPYAVFIFFCFSILVSISIRRPIKSIFVPVGKHDYGVEVRIANLFDVSGAIMISTNTVFESDVAGGKISPDSLQGQFTAKYFTGNQNILISQIAQALQQTNGTAPYPMGTIVPITTHGKTFYFTAMAELNAQGNATTNLEYIKAALEGLWKYVTNAGQLQELAVPVIGTGRGRLQISRKKMITIIAESFVEASQICKFTEKLVIVVRPEDSKKFGVNLYEIKDYLNQTLNT